MCVHACNHAENVRSSEARWQRRRRCSEKVVESPARVGPGTRRMDKLQGAGNNEAPVLGRTSEIGASRGYKSRGTRPPSRSVKRPIDVFQLVQTMRVARAAIRS